MAPKNEVKIALLKKMIVWSGNYTLPPSVDGESLVLAAMLLLTKNNLKAEKSCRRVERNNGWL